MDEPYFTVDIEALNELKFVYENAMEFIEEDLPKINLNSRNEIINFFEKTFKIRLDSTKISEIEQYKLKYDGDSMEAETIQGIVMYFKMKYALRNYINPMIKSGEKYVPRMYFGDLTMNNKQPLPKAPEILACITETFNGLQLERNKQDEATSLIYYKEE